MLHTKDLQAALVAVGCVVALAACGSGDTAKSAEPTTTPTASSAPGDAMTALSQARTAGALLQLFCTSVSILDGMSQAIENVAQISTNATEKTIEVLATQVKDLRPLAPKPLQDDLDSVTTLLLTMELDLRAHTANLTEHKAAASRAFAQLATAVKQECGVDIG